MKQEALVLAAFYIVSLAGLAMLLYPATTGFASRGQGVTVVPQGNTHSPFVPSVRIKERFFFVDESGTINFTSTGSANVSDSPISG